MTIELASVIPTFVVTKFQTFLIVTTLHTKIQKYTRFFWRRVVNVSTCCKAYCVAQMEKQSGTGATPDSSSKYPVPSLAEMFL